MIQITNLTSVTIECGCRLSGSVCKLHNWLMFLVHNLQSYLQLDVLESEFTMFSETLMESQTFEQVIHGHSVFLTHIMSQAFLLTKQVSTKFETLLEI